MNTNRIATVVDVLPLQFTILYCNNRPGIAPITDIIQIITPYAMLTLPKIITAIADEILFIIDKNIPVLPATSGN
jgi:hypothetical protein